MARIPAKFVPHNKYVKEEELHKDISNHRFEGFTEIVPVKERDLDRNYTFLAISVVLGAINDAISVLSKWRGEEYWWVEEAYPKWKKGASKVKLGKKYGQHPKDLHTTLIHYEAELRGDRNYVDWFGKDEARVYLELLNVTEHDCLMVIDDVVSGERKVGISEPDIQEMFLPEFEEIRRKKPIKVRY